MRNAEPSIARLSSCCLPHGAFRVLNVSAVLLCCAAPLAAGEITLATELKVSGPVVTLHAPLGLRYRPGYPLPLQVRVHNPGAAFSAELFVAQGDDGPRCGLFQGLSFPERTTRVFMLPVRAPAVSAGVSLVIRELDSGGGLGPLRFQASLARVLRPLPPDAQVILTCSASAPLTFGPQQEVVQTGAAEFPDEDWMYENLDLVVLGDGSFKDASPAAQQALRRWLLGGGRLLIAAGEALPAAVAARLLPLDDAAAGGVIGADMLWWEKHAGLKPDGVLFQKKERPVYIHLNIGFGEVVSLFPATSAEEAREYGAAAVNHPVLQRPRDNVPDLRVQPDRFAAFTPGVASAGLRGRAARWIALGALVLCLGLALGYTSRSHLTAAACPLVVAVFLAVLLAKWFPVRDLAVSRIDVARQSADGRAIATREWALVEAFNDPAAVAIAGLVTPIYADTAELNSAQLQVVLNGAQPRANVVVYPSQPALFTIAAPKPEDAPGGILRTLRSRSGAATLAFRVGPALQPPAAGAAVWARSDGSLHLLKNLDAGDAFDLAPFDDWASIVRAAAPGGTRSPARSDDGTVRARAAALSWASREALRSRRDTLIFWQDLPGEHGGLVELEPPSTNAGSTFQILTVQTR